MALDGSHASVVALMCCITLASTAEEIKRVLGHVTMGSDEEKTLNDRLAQLSAPQS